MIRQKTTVIRGPILDMFDVFDDEDVDGPRILWWGLLSFVSFEIELVSESRRRPQGPTSTQSVLVVSVLPTLPSPPGVLLEILLADPWMSKAAQSSDCDTVTEKSGDRPVVPRTGKFQHFRDGIHSIFALLVHLVKFSSSCLVSIDRCGLRLQ